MAAEAKATSHSISTAVQEAVQSYKNKIAMGKSLQQIEAGSHWWHAMNHARAQSIHWFLWLTIIWPCYFYKDILYSIK